ncbi:MAG: acetyl-CoA carboxylase carboxyltransferase subunit alpha [Brevinema sp.]
MVKYLDFEQELKEIDLAIDILQSDLESDLVQVHALEDQKKSILNYLYQDLTPWQTTQVARHPDRPGFSDYTAQMFSEFIEIHGDRVFGDDGAIITGWAELGGEKFMVIGQEKGKDVHSRIKRNFGMPNPEGYRKALRAVKIAEKFKKPVLTFVDTPGAYPGIGAEERGQGEAIAKNIMEFFGIKTPIISIVIGEGGSGGALGIAVADRVLILGHAIYSVISPESCASILWHDSTKVQQAAEALKYTPKYLKEFGVVDQIISEPVGGAHRDPKTIMKTVSSIIIDNLQQLRKKNIVKLLNDRYERFRKIGYFMNNEIIY